MSVGSLTHIIKSKSRLPASNVKRTCDGSIKQYRDYGFAKTVKMMLVARARAQIPERTHFRYIARAPKPLVKIPAASNHLTTRISNTNESCAGHFFSFTSLRPRGPRGQSSRGPLFQLLLPSRKAIYTFRGLSVVPRDMLRPSRLWPR